MLANTFEKNRFDSECLEWWRWTKNWRLRYHIFPSYVLLIHKITANEYTFIYLEYETEQKNVLIAGGKEENTTVVKPKFHSNKEEQAVTLVAHQNKGWYLKKF